MQCGVMNPGILLIVGSISEHHAAGHSGSEIALPVLGFLSTASDIGMFVLFTTTHWSGLPTSQDAKTDSTIHLTAGRIDSAVGG